MSLSDGQARKAGRHALVHDLRVRQTRQRHAKGDVIRANACGESRKFQQARQRRESGSRAQGPELVHDWTGFVIRIGLPLVLTRTGGRQRVAVLDAHFVEVVVHVLEHFRSLAGAKAGRIERSGGDAGTVTVELRAPDCRAAVVSQADD